MAAALLSAFLSPPAQAAQQPQSGPKPQRILFREIGPSDPKRDVIQNVLDSSFYSMRSGFSSSEWTSGHYGGAWERARQYFPNHVYYNPSQQYFMTHFFNPNGKLEMEIFDSDYLRMCVANRGTFTSRGIVASYRTMLGADPQAAADFARKLGELEPYFRDESAKDRLKQMIGERLFDRLLGELRRENYHMFAGALLHEGMHAKMDDDKLVRAIQDEYKGCKLPVQWDELRAYMSEINYHSKFYTWAVGDMAASWRAIDSQLRELEAWRKRPKPLSAADRAKIEAIKARIKAYIALIRLRMREIWQSANRIKGLVLSFQQDYLKPAAPAEHREMLERLLVAVTDFCGRVGDEIMRQEVMLRDLEQQLNLWNKWAACELPSPPPPEVAADIIKRAKGTTWPVPPGDQAENIRKKAEREIGKVPGSLQPGLRRSGSGNLGFMFSAAYIGAAPSMNAQNGYLDYLNQVWDGDLPAFGWEHGFGFGFGRRLSPSFEVGLAFERSSAGVSGNLRAVGSLYVSTHSLTSYGPYLAWRGPKIAPAWRITALASLAWCSVRYRETENGSGAGASDGGLKWMLLLGPEFEVATRLSFSLTAGYRQASLDGFDANFYMPGSPPVRLEFTGFTVRAGLALRL
jgi:hypothetical protein